MADTHAPCAAKNIAATISMNAITCGEKRSIALPVRGASGDPTDSGRRLRTAAHGQCASTPARIQGGRAAGVAPKLHRRPDTRADTARPSPGTRLLC